MAKNFIFAVFCQKGDERECFDRGEGLKMFMDIIRDPTHEHTKELSRDDRIVKLKAFDVYASRDSPLGELPDTGRYGRVVFVGWGEGNIFTDETTFDIDMETFNDFLQEIFSAKIVGVPYSDDTWDASWIIFRVPDGCNVDKLTFSDLIMAGSGK